MGLSVLPLGSGEAENNNEGEGAVKAGRGLVENGCCPSGQSHGVGGVPPSRATDFVCLVWFHCV